MDPLILYTDGRVVKAPLPKSKRKGYSLQELYAMTGVTQIESITICDGETIMIVDEEARLKPNQQANLMATSLAERAILGTAVVIPSEMLK